MTARNLTNLDLLRVFGVTDVTIYNWRNPKEGARKTALPSTVKDGRVTFTPSRVTAWAKKNEVPIAVDPAKVAAGAPTAKKPGPKVAAKKTAAKKATAKGAAFRKQANREVRAAADRKARKSGKGGNVVKLRA
jgi:hypothetical protein